MSVNDDKIGNVKKYTPFAGHFDGHGNVCVTETLARDGCLQYYRLLQPCCTCPPRLVICLLELKGSMDTTLSFPPTTGVLPPKGSVRRNNIIT